MRLFNLLLLLFLAIPVIEIYLLIEVGSQIGALPTILLVVLTALVGASLLRQQGFSTWARINARMAAGEAPAMELLEGLLLLIAGALLLTPGFFTDTIGFLLLIPPLRRFWISAVLQRALFVQIRGHQRPPGTGSASQGDSQTLEGEYWREDEPPRR